MYICFSVESVLYPDKSIINWRHGVKIALSAVNTHHIFVEWSVHSEACRLISPRLCDWLVAADACSWKAL